QGADRGARRPRLDPRSVVLRARGVADHAEEIRRRGEDRECVLQSADAGRVVRALPPAAGAGVHGAGEHPRRGQRAEEVQADVPELEAGRQRRHDPARPRAASGRKAVMQLRRAVVTALLLCAVPLFGQLTPFGSVDAGGQQVTLEGSVQSRSGETVQGTITAKIAPSWHINSYKPLDSFSIPTTLKFDNAELVDAKFPPHEVKSFTFSAGSQLAVYEGTIEIPFTAKLPASATSLKATLHYQSCNDKVCLPPKNASVEFNVGRVLQPGPATATPEPGQSTRPTFTPLSAA